MSDSLLKQEALFYTITRALDNFKKVGRDNYTPAKIRARIGSLRATWQQCVEENVVLLRAIPESKRHSLDYFSKDQFAIHEERYQATLDYMTEQLEELEPYVSPNQSMINASSPVSASTRLTSPSLQHLPPIQLPPFSGKFEEWETFRDRFQALIISNKDLSEFMRMHFLVSSLTGHARDTIASIPVTADNFASAWRALTARYENKHRLIEIHVATLYNLPSVTRESASELHALRDKAERAISALKRLDRSSEEILDDILVYFVTQKLDSATRRAWKLRSPPTFETLIRFLSARAQALEDLSRQAC